MVQCLLYWLLIYVLLYVWMKGKHTCGHICAVAHKWKSNDSSLESRLLSMCIQMGVQGWNSAPHARTAGPLSAEPPYWPQLDVNGTKNTQLSTKKTVIFRLCRKEAHIIQRCGKIAEEPELDPNLLKPDHICLWRNRTRNARPPWEEKMNVWKGRSAINKEKPNSQYSFAWSPSLHVYGCVPPCIPGVYWGDKLHNSWLMLQRQNSPKPIWFFPILYMVLTSLPFTKTLFFHLVFSESSPPL